VTQQLLELRMARNEAVNRCDEPGKDQQHADPHHRVHRHTHHAVVHRRSFDEHWKVRANADGKSDGSRPESEAVVETDAAAIHRGAAERGYKDIGEIIGGKSGEAPEYTIAAGRADAARAS
jgi:hypothetical protein